MEFLNNDTNERIELSVLYYDSGNWIDVELCQALGIQIINCGSREWDYDSIDTSNIDENYTIITYGSPITCYCCAIKTTLNNDEFNALIKKEKKYVAELIKKEKRQSILAKKEWRTKTIERFKSIGITENQGWKAYNAIGKWMFEPNFIEFIEYVSLNLNSILKHYNKIHSNKFADNFGIPVDTFPRRMAKINAALEIIFCDN